jgi:hypothetical protein
VLTQISVDARWQENAGATSPTVRQQFVVIGYELHSKQLAGMNTQDM